MNGEPFFIGRIPYATTQEERGVLIPRSRLADRCVDRRLSILRDQVESEDLF